MPIFHPNDLARARQRSKENPWSAEILAAIRARACQRRVNFVATSQMSD
jgi:hypothetical protein